MSYELAPSTVLLASSCAFCGRPLRDAISVECGVGPDCREKHGYGEAQSMPQWFTVSALLGSIGIDSHEFATEDDGGAHKLANKLIHHVACDVKAPDVAIVILSIKALGYVAIASVLAKRVGGIVVEECDGVLTVHAPFSDTFNVAIRNVPGQRWDSAAKVRRVPVTSRRELFLALRSAFPGRPCFGSKGAAVL